MTRQNPRRAAKGIVFTLVVACALLGGCKDEPDEGAKPPHSHSEPENTPPTASDDVRISAFRDGTGWRIVAFFPKTAPDVAPTTLEVLEGDGSNSGSMEAPRGGDLTETPCSFRFENPVGPLTFRWTRRDGTVGKRVWRIPQ